MTFRDFLGPEAVAQLRERFEQTLDAEAGFMIMFKGSDEPQAFDAYLGVCDHCVRHIVDHSVVSAMQAGTLHQEGVAKMQGHKHDYSGEHGGHSHD